MPMEDWPSSEYWLVVLPLVIERLTTSTRMLTRGTNTGNQLADTFRHRDYASLRGMTSASRDFLQNRLRTHVQGHWIPLAAAVQAVLWTLKCST